RGGGAVRNQNGARPSRRWHPAPLVKQSQSSTPKESQILAGGRAERDHRTEALSAADPGGVAEPAGALRPLRGRLTTAARIRWSRSARPPANICHPSGVPMLS